MDEPLESQIASGPLVGGDRRSFLKQAGSVALLSGGALFLAGCGNGDGGAAEDNGSGDAADDDDALAEEPTPEPDADVDDVIFLSIIPPESLWYSPELLAISRGYFADEGLSVRMQPTRGSAQAVQGLLSELAIITRVGDIEVMLAVGERGADELVNLGTLDKISPIRFVSSPDNPVTSAEDFAGQLIGIPSEGGTSELTVDLVGLSAGIDDLDKQVVGLSPGTFDLVEDGRIACYAVALDTAVLLEETRGAVIFSPGDAITAGGVCYMGNRIALEREDDDTARNQVQGFMNALRRALDDIIADEDNDFESTLSTLREDYEFDSLMNDEVAIGTLQEYVVSWTLDGPENLLRTTDDRWAGVYEELVSVDSMEAGQDVSGWYSNEFVD